MSIYNLCFNCGTVTDVNTWQNYKHSEDNDELLVVSDDGDDLYRCPVCLWDHTDDDSGPGFFDGTPKACELERASWLKEQDCAEHWADTLSAVSRHTRLTPMESETLLNLVRDSRLQYDDVVVIFHKLTQVIRGRPA